MGYGKPIKCSEPECVETCGNYAYGEILASKSGWFFQKNGDCWCPSHIPEWVEEWRKNQQKSKGF